MTGPIDLRIIELIAARLCHDLIGPISAVNHGVELVDDESPDFIRDAVALVADSALKATRRLQFYRFAFGYRGGGLAGSAPHILATDYFNGTSVACDYSAEAREMPLEQQKLACVMLTLAAEGLPRGGKLVLGAGADGPQIDAAGDGTGPSADARAALALTAPVDDLTSRTVGGYFAGLLADRLGCRLVVIDRSGGFSLVTEPA
ncbi:MAG TPA: histidine phosphotransferase family protein [Stellaceae bacterium]|jgi:histidine phosphotransferase ChpT|nr:histidine phosphotransferase family protein [Stellaceae bacterium]